MNRYDNLLVTFLIPFVSLLLVFILVTIGIPFSHLKALAKEYDANRYLNYSLDSFLSSLDDEDYGVQYPEILGISDNTSFSNTENQTRYPLEAVDIENDELMESLTHEKAIIDKVEKQLNSDEDGEIQSSNGNIKVTVPKGAAVSTTNFSMVEYLPQGSTGMRMVKEFQLNALDTESKNEVTRFYKVLQISLKHTAEELVGLDVDSLNLYYLEEATGQWILVPGEFDKETLVLTAKVDHFTFFGEQANPFESGPGRVMASQVNLHSGAATYGYPVELPPAPGGFQPSISLAYNSASVDEMKNKKDVGSWVGIGWSLDLGSISCDGSGQTYYLNINNVSVKLYATSPTEYRTDPEYFYKITRSGDTWNVYDTSGNFYRFGQNTDAIQYRDYNINYKWNLSYWEDTDGNGASVSYNQTIWNNTVRSAYPEYLKYNDDLVEVHFTTGFDENSTYGPVRYDNPISSTANPIPKIMENKRLDSIEISVDGDLLRKYEFSYSTTNRCYSNDYSGIYYAGTLTLESITEYGSDGQSALPETSFIYQDKFVHRVTNDIWFNGNPGNPAYLTWPFLVSINNGYGADVDFSYTQIPSSGSYYLWTRQAVTSKTIDSGIGVEEAYSYAYTGDPCYVGNGWDQEFRGWNEVKVTDASGAYENHYFYTSGIINGKDAEQLTGKEYETKWYSSSDTLLKTKTYTWDWAQTNTYLAGPYQDITPYQEGTINVGSQLADVDVSDDGHIYAAVGSGLIRKYDSSGTLVGGWSIGSAVSGVSVSSDGFVYVAVSSGQVGKFTTSGTRVGNWWNIYTPVSDVSASSDGFVYIAVNGGYVGKFDSSGTRIGNWWNTGSGSAVSASNDGFVYVDSGYYIKKYSATGTVVTQWGYFSTPRLHANDGYVYVVSGDNVKKYTSTGEMLSGTIVMAATLTGVSATNDGYVYVTSGDQIKKYHFASLTSYTAKKNIPVSRRRNDWIKNCSH